MALPSQGTPVTGHSRQRVFRHSALPHSFRHIGTPVTGHSRPGHSHMALPSQGTPVACHSRHRAHPSKGTPVTGHSRGTQGTHVTYSRHRALVTGSFRSHGTLVKGYSRHRTLDHSRHRALPSQDIPVTGHLIPSPSTPVTGRSRHGALRSHGTPVTGRTLT